jgi:Uma2 family endonuclease
MKGLPKLQQLPESIGPIPYRFSIEEYEHLLQTGILVDGSRIELIDGVIYQTMGQSDSHRLTVHLLNSWLGKMLPEGITHTCQSPIRLVRENSEPEPDLAILKGGPRDYTSKAPGPKDVLLLIEVSTTTLEFDRFEKLPRYASSMIPSVWIINLIDRCVEVYSSPIKGKNPRYRRVETYTDGDMVELNLADHEPLRLAVAELLP